MSDQPRSAAKPRYIEGSTALHRCDPSKGAELCSCVYDDTCTGRESRRLVKLPLWLQRVRWPLHYLAVRRARRILQANGAWRERY